MRGAIDTRKFKSTCGVAGISFLSFSKHSVYVSHNSCFLIKVYMVAIAAYHVHLGGQSVGRQYPRVGYCSKLNRYGTGIGT